MKCILPGQERYTKSGKPVFLMATFFLLFKEVGYLFPPGKVITPKMARQVHFLIDDNCARLM
jgi:hypothetical protein